MPRVRVARTRGRVDTRGGAHVAGVGADRRYAARDRRLQHILCAPVLVAVSEGGRAPAALRVHLAEWAGPQCGEQPCDGLAACAEWHGTTTPEARCSKPARVAGIRGPISHTAQRSPYYTVCPTELAGFKDLCPSCTTCSCQLSAVPSDDSFFFDILSMHLLPLPGQDAMYN